jgi:hypothetical protein
MANTLIMAERTFDFAACRVYKEAFSFRLIWGNKSPVRLIFALGKQGYWPSLQQNEEHKGDSDNLELGEGILDDIAEISGTAFEGFVAEYVARFEDRPRGPPVSLYPVRRTSTLKESQL